MRIKKTASSIWTNCIYLTHLRQAVSRVQKDSYITLLHLKWHLTQPKRVIDSVILNEKNLLLWIHVNSTKFLFFRCLCFCRLIMFWNSFRYRTYLASWMCNMYAFILIWICFHIWYFFTRFNVKKVFEKRCKPGLYSPISL